MKRVHFLRVYNKHILRKQDCVKFRGRIAWHSFLENNLAEFLDEVRVKINQDFIQSLVVFRYSNICYWNWDLLGSKWKIFPYFSVGVFVLRESIYVV